MFKKNQNIISFLLMSQISVNNIMMPFYYVDQI